MPDTEAYLDDIHPTPLVFLLHLFPGPESPLSHNFDLILRTKFILSTAKFWLGIAEILTFPCTFADFLSDKIKKGHNNYPK